MKPANSPLHPTAAGELPKSLGISMAKEVEPCSFGERSLGRIALGARLDFWGSILYAVATQPLRTSCRRRRGGARRQGESLGAHAGSGAASPTTAARSAAPASVSA
jgi:hypothetical protein